MRSRELFGRPSTLRPTNIHCQVRLTLYVCVCRSQQISSLLVLYMGPFRRGETLNHLHYFAVYIIYNGERSEVCLLLTRSSSSLNISSLYFFPCYLKFPRVCYARVACAPDPARTPYTYNYRHRYKSRHKRMAQWHTMHAGQP